MVVTDQAWDSDARRPWACWPATRSAAVKPKLRLNTGEPDAAPQPLKFTPPGKQDRGPNDIVQGVERAIEDAQRRLEDLRKLVFPEGDDDGPRAA